MMIPLGTMKATSDDMTRGAAGSKGASKSGQPVGHTGSAFPTRPRRLRMAAKSQNRRGMRPAPERRSTSAARYLMTRFEGPIAPSARGFPQWLFDKQPFQHIIANPELMDPVKCHYRWVHRNGRKTVVVYQQLTVKL